MKVYTLLVDDLGIKTKTIHQWREAGALSAMMKHTFNTQLSSAQLQGVEYEWFCQHESTFGPGGSAPESDETTMWLLDAHHTARELIARTATNGARPAPCDGTGLWVSFGFCGCSDQDEEAYLGSQFLFLFRTATFQEFVDACATSTLTKLFSDKGLPIGSPYIQDALTDRPSAKSVWTLKEFVCADEEMRQDSKPPLPICVDYGFFNCRNSEEEACLRSIYKIILDKPDSDPLALHQACLRGELFDHCRQLLDLDPPGKFRRLMRNVYPLPEVEEDPETLESDQSSAEPRVTEAPTEGVPYIPPPQSHRTESHRVEESDFRAMLQAGWQSRFK